MSHEMKVQEFIEQHVAITKPLGHEGALAWWDNALTGSDEAAERAAAVSAQIIRIYADPEKYAFLKQFEKEKFEDPLIARQYELLLRGFQGEQMPDEIIDKMVHLEKEVGQEYNNYRAVVRGATTTENEIRAILRDSDDSEYRKEAWEASKLLGSRVSERVIEMVRLRNEVARSLGFPNHYTKSLTLDELDEERLFALFEELTELTDPLWNEWKAEFDARQAARFGITAGELRPWHYTDQFFQEAPPSDSDLDRYFEGKNLEDITRRFYTAIGLPIEDVLSRSDLYEKPGKSQHAFCSDMDREGDVRVLCNIKPNEYWMGTMLHEFGHAVYDVYTDQSLPYILRGPCHTLATEAIAELMGRFSKDGTWLRLYAGVPAEEAEEIDRKTREETRVKFLIVTRWFLVMCHFERELYRDPEQNLNSLWWDIVERYQGIHRPDDRNAPDWASKLHLALAPVYYQNYLLGEMEAAQMLQYIKRNVVADGGEEGVFTDPRVGQWLREKIFEPGNVRPWEDALEYATGERLNPAYYVAQLKR